MRFSIIVPVYNVEKYIEKCLDSIVNQTYQNFEVLVINDGTKDNSQKIIDEYEKKYPSKVKSFIKENGGLSDARNYGVDRANGEYILFIDSDDYIDLKLLEKINEEIEKYGTLDVIGYNFIQMNNNYEKIGTMFKPEIHNVSGEEAISELVLGKQCFEPACGFAYRLQFWKENRFEFIKGIIHEDFALIPLVVTKAENVSFLDYYGYFYISTSNSITRNKDLEKEKKSAKDILTGYDYLVNEFEKHEFKNEISKKLILSYISNSLIFKLDNMSDVLKDDYRKQIKSRNVSKNIMSDTFKRKIRKLLIKCKFKI